MNTIRTWAYQHRARVTEPQIAALAAAAGTVSRWQGVRAGAGSLRDVQRALEGNTMSNYPGEFARCHCGREAFYQQWGDRPDGVDDFYCEGCGQPTDDCPCAPQPGYEDEDGAGDGAAGPRALGEG